MKSADRFAGFTLIELLVVIAIILILIAIALPNFLAARDNAVVARAWSEMRTVAYALESYAVDFRAYPHHGERLADGTVNFPGGTGGLTTFEFLYAAPLTTPHVYLETVPVDATMKEPEDPTMAQYGYIQSLQMKETLIRRGILSSAENVEPRYGSWRLFAAGLDGDKGGDAKTSILYSPTNGVRSDGDLVRSQKSPFEKLGADER